MRKADRRELSVTASTECLMGIDWHPELRHWIATSGRDRSVKVWLARDEASVRRGADTAIAAIAATVAVRWRPAHKAQLASACLHKDFSIGVFDVRRPCVPRATFEDQRDGTCDMAWLDLEGRELLSASRDGCLYLHFHSLAGRPAERAPTMALAVDHKGGVTVASRARQRDRNVSVSAIEKHVRECLKV